MSHEMTRADAEREGIDTHGLPVSIEGDTLAEDIIDVWDRLPNADEFNPPDAA